MEWLQKRVDEHLPVGPDSLALVRLGERCNHACPMCTNSGHLAGRVPDAPELLGRIDFVAERGVPRVVLTGGEPTIHPAFFDVVERVVAHGMRWDVNTNGRAFGHAPFAKHAAREGLGRALVSLHSHSPEVHAMISGTSARAHAQTIAGIRHLRDEGVDVVVNLVLTVHSLPEVAQYLAFCSEELGAGVGIKIAFPSLYSQGREWAGIDVRYRQVKAALADLAGSIGLGLMLEGFPNCVDGDPQRPDMGRLGWGETHYLDDRTGDRLHSIAFIASRTRVYAPACKRCLAFACCPGVERPYAERHGLEELQVFPDPRRPWWSQ